MWLPPPEEMIISDAHPHQSSRNQRAAEQEPIRYELIVMAPGWWGTFAVFSQTNTFCFLLMWKHVKVDSNLNYMLTYALHHRDCFPAASSSVSKNLVSSWQRLQILKQEWFDRPKHKPVCLTLCLRPGVCAVELPENSSNAQWIEI